MNPRPVATGDGPLLAELFAVLDATHFHPHPMTATEAERIAGLAGQDIYLVWLDGSKAVAYGMLRGWDEGYEVPSLGIAVRPDREHRGYGRAMMAALADAARARGATTIRLRVGDDNQRAHRLYELMGYRDAGTERGETVMLLDLVPWPKP